MYRADSAYPVGGGIGDPPAHLTNQWECAQERAHRERKEARRKAATKTPPGPFSVAKHVIGPDLRLGTQYELRIYKVISPPELVVFLLRNGTSVIGEMSEPNRVTLDDVSRQKAHIPRDAEYFAFLYPPLTGRAGGRPEAAGGGSGEWEGNSLEKGFSAVSVNQSFGPGLLGSGALAVTSPAEGETVSGRSSTRDTALYHPPAGVRSFLDLGGFAYFDEKKDLLQVNALTYGAEPVFHFNGAYDMPPAFAAAMLNQGVFKQSDFGPFYAWLPPSTNLPEQPVGPGGFGFVKFVDPAGDEMTRQPTNPSEFKLEGWYFVLRPPAEEPAEGDSKSHGSAASAPAEGLKPSGTTSPRSAWQRQYAQLEEVGRGSFGSVFRAIRKDGHGAGQFVAMKIIDRKLHDTEATRNEFNVMRNLGHENVVQIIAFYVEATQSVIIMEYVQGGSLGDLITTLSQLHQRIGMPLQMLVRFLRQIISGVGYLSKSNVVHRDLKPDNILLTANGVVKIIDLGAARLHQPGDNHNWDLADEFTPLYCSPEALAGDFSTASDMWAVGCVGLEMATGEKPWNHLLHLGPACIMLRVGNGHPDSEKEPVLQHPLPDHLHSALREVIRACMRRDPRQRPVAQRLLAMPLFFCSSDELEEHERRTREAVCTKAATQYAKTIPMGRREPTGDEFSDSGADTPISPPATQPSPQLGTQRRGQTPEGPQPDKSSTEQFPPPALGDSGMSEVGVGDPATLPKYLREVELAKIIDWLLRCISRERPRTLYGVLDVMRRAVDSAQADLRPRLTDREWADVLLTTTSAPPTAP